jgi:diamine N-acetyltransferase
VLEVMNWNAAGIRAYEKAGFRLVGRRREALLSGGRRVDEVIMDALASEFTGSVIAGTTRT